MNVLEALKSWITGGPPPGPPPADPVHDPALDEVRRRQSEAARWLAHERDTRRRRIDATADSWRREDE